MLHCQVIGFGLGLDRPRTGWNTPHPWNPRRTHPRSRSTGPTHSVARPYGWGLSSSSDSPSRSAKADDGVPLPRRRFGGDGVAHLSGARVESSVRKYRDTLLARDPPTGGLPTRNLEAGGLGGGRVLGSSTASRVRVRACVRSGCKTPHRAQVGALHSVLGRCCWGEQRHCLARLCA